MYRIDNSTASPTLPAPGPPGTPGFFTSGSIGGQLATIVTADIMNEFQEELIAVVTAAGLNLDKTDNTQVIQAILSLIARQTRRRLTGPFDLYCDPHGSDTNDGLTPDTPFATPTAAYNLLLTAYDLGGQTVTVRMADGTYAPFALNGAPIGLLTPANLIFLGNVDDPAQVVVSQATALGNCVSLSYFGGCMLQGMTLQGPATQTNCIRTAFGAKVFFQDLIFGGCGTAHMWADWASGIFPFGPYSIIGNAAMHMFAYAGGQCGGQLGQAPYQITLLNGPHFSTAFCYATDHSYVLWESEVAQFSGAATGQKFYVSNLSHIDTTGGGPNYFPGDVAGTVDAASFGLYT